ncbi:P13 family porin [Treponema sp. OMZ 840]|uniref:P13 family porin n=1 Tax=Treponema sp. OMZ 840 TaxID=244313 RepID=UPI003D909AA8
MKRKCGFYLFCALFICTAFFATAETAVVSPDGTSEQHVENITNMLKWPGLKKSFEQIRTESAHLSFAQKEQIFSLHKSDPLAPFLLNCFVGFGVGSFVQKDYLSGGICLAADITSFGLGLTGLILWQKELFDASRNANKDGGALFLMVFNAFSGATALPFFVAGGILSTAVRIYGMIAPWVYGASYDEQLQKALRVGEAQVSFAPLVLSDASCGIALCIRY